VVSGPSDAEFQALLAAHRQTSAEVEALVLRVAHLEGTMRRMNTVVQAIVKQLAEFRDGG